MSTRSVLVFTDGDETINVYKHNDGYPQGSGNVKLLKEILSQGQDLQAIKNNLSQDEPVYPSQGRARIEGSYKESLKPAHFGEQSDLEFVYLVDLKNNHINIYGNNIKEYTKEAIGTPAEHLACGTINIDKFKTDTVNESTAQYKEQALDEVLELKNDIRLFEQIGFKVNQSHAIENSSEIQQAKKTLGIATETEQSTEVKENRTVRQQIVDRIIDGLENNQMPWQKPWVNASRPYNPTTGTIYKGANNMLLSMTDYDDPRFMTFKQANDQGYSIKKGEKGIPIIKVVEYEKEKENKETGEIEIEKKPAIKMYTVFNASQIDGIPQLEKKEKSFNTIEVAEQILENSGAVIKHGGSQAYYNTKSDEIKLPEKSSFHTEKDYYSTALHELAHWTGAESRLNRDLSGEFGSKSYAKEELRAEFASAIVGAELGLPLSKEHIDNHSAYIKSWVSVLKENPGELFKAVNDAEKITDHILSFNKELNLDKELLKKQYLDVQFKDKDIVKELGAEYDAQKKKWFVPLGADVEAFAKWMPTQQEQNAKDCLEKTAPALSKATDLNDKDKAEQLTNIAKTAKVQGQELSLPTEKEYAGIISTSTKDYYVVKTFEKENIVVQATDKNKAVEVKDNDIVSGKGNELKNVGSIENIQNFESQLKDKKVEQAKDGKMYGGTILDVQNDIVLQQVTKDKVVLHQKDKLNKEVKAGDKVQIYYGANKTIVTDRSKQNQNER